MAATDGRPVVYYVDGVDPVLRRAVRRFYNSLGEWIGTRLHPPQGLELRHTDVVSGMVAGHSYTPYDADP